MLNQVLIMGKVARDPKRTEKGLFFTVKTSEQYQKDGQTKWDNQFHSVSLFGQSANRLASQIRDGADVFVEGKLTTYKDQQGAYRTSILAKTVRVLGAPEVGEDDDMGRMPSDDSGDIPF